MHWYFAVLISSILLWSLFSEFYLLLDFFLFFFYLLEVKLRLLILDLSCFPKIALKAVTFTLSTAFPAYHTFWYVVLLFPVNFLIFLVIYFSSKDYLEIGCSTSKYLWFPQFIYSWFIFFCWDQWTYFVFQFLMNLLILILCGAYVCLGQCVTWSWKEFVIWCCEVEGSLNVT